MNSTLGTVDLNVRCASCGYAWGFPGWGRPSGDELALLVSRHLIEDCPQRTWMHPMFGFKARWNRLSEDPETVEIAWTTEAWGLPLDLEKGPL